MTTAIEIITDSLEDIGYKASETPIEPADSQLCLRLLNDMLAEWSGSGINLGADPVASAADTVRIPRWAVSAVKLNLAGRAAVPFKRPITPTLSASINAATASMLRALVKPINPSYPGTLPLGGGNQCASDNWDDRFFPADQKENF